MPLISCPDCNNKISDRAESCPHCGLPAKYFNASGKYDNAVSDSVVLLDMTAKKNQAAEI